VCGRLGGLAPCLCLCPCCKSLWGRGGACGQLLGSLCQYGLRCARAWGSTFCGWLGRCVVDLVCLGSIVQKGSSVRGVVEACGASDLACGGPGLYMCWHGWASSISPLLSTCVVPARVLRVFFPCACRGSFGATCPVLSSCVYPCLKPWLGGCVVWALVWGAGHPLLSVSPLFPPSLHPSFFPLG